MPKPNSLILFLKKQPRWRIATLAILLVLGVFLFKGGRKSVDNGATFVARRGPLDITVIEGGSLQALEFQQIKCEVRVGYQGTKILKIVDEGYQVTEEDVRTNKVLVELDSSDLQKQIVQQEIQYQSAVASLTDAQQSYEIQLNQNLSDIQTAEHEARFTRLDFDKFLGDTVTQEIIDRIGLEKELALEATNEADNARAAAPATATVPSNKGIEPPPSADAPRAIVLAGGVEPAVPLPASGSPPAPPPASSPNAESAGANAATNETPAITVDFSKYARIEVLGDGEAKQKLRKFEDDLQVAQKELGQAQSTLDGTKRLFEKGFVTRTDLERDEIAFENARLKVQTADTARDLFIKYDFTKSAEEALSKYVEAVRKLDRAKKAAISKLAQADAKLKSAQGNYNIQVRQRTELNEQLEKCTLRAEKPGLVVYGGGGDEMYYYGNQEPIREGATVRERQAIITIPDMTKMSVKVKIHESYIKKVKKGEKARITVDAFPDQVLNGEVTQVGVLPDSQNRWMNPDLKVYLTTITINGTYDWVKPGMSAKVEIMVDQLENVVYVPIQSVAPSEGKQICYIANGFKPEPREVEIGEFNDEFIEIKKGLKEGDRVLLHLPESGEPESGGNKPADDGKPKTKPAEPSTPASAATTGKA